MVLLCKSMVLVGNSMVLLSKSTALLSKSMVLLSNWRLLDVLSHLLDWNPSSPQSNLGGFNLSSFYMLVMVRRGEADDKLPHGDLTADGRDAIRVRFVRNAMVASSGSTLS